MENTPPPTYDYKPTDVDAKIAAERQAGSQYAFIFEAETPQPPRKGLFAWLTHVPRRSLLFSAMALVTIFAVGGTGLALFMQSRDNGSIAKVTTESTAGLTGNNAAKNGTKPTPGTLPTAGSPDDESAIPDISEGDGDDDNGSDDTGNADTDYDDSGSDDATSGDTGDVDDEETPGVNIPGPVPQPAPAPTPLPVTPKVEKLLVFVLEKRTLAEAKTGMPYAYSLAQRYGYATNYRPVTERVLPNTLAIVGGDTYGIADNNDPSAHKITATSVFGQARAANKSVKVYAESIPSPCAQTSSGTYAVSRNAWTYFVNERTACDLYDRSMTVFSDNAAAGVFPAVGMVLPNTQNSGYEGSMATADAWFKARMTQVFAGPDWKSGKLAVVLTFDRDSATTNEPIMTVVIHSSQNKKIVTTAMNHYSLSRLYSEVLRVTPLSKAKTAPSMVTNFGLPL